MLTPAEVADLQRAAYRSQHRAHGTRRVPIIFRGGPLDGIRITVSPFDASCHTIGFATVTATGPVQALYERRGDGPDRVFGGYDGPPAAAPGHVAIEDGPPAGRSQRASSTIPSAVVIPFTAAGDAVRSRRRVLPCGRSRRCHQEPDGGGAEDEEGHRE